MADTNKVIREAIVTSINGETFSPAITAVSTAARGIFAEELTSTPICYVRVAPDVPITTPDVEGVRDSRSIDVPIQIVIAARGKAMDLALSDAISSLADDVDAHLYNDLSQIPAAGAEWIESQIEQAFSSNQLREFGMSQTTITVVYRYAR